MIDPLLAGAAKTLVVSMLSERVVLRVLVMLSEQAAAKSTNSIDDRLVTELKAKLESDVKIGKNQTLKMEKKCKWRCSKTMFGVKHTQMASVFLLKKIEKGNANARWALNDTGFDRNQPCKIG